MEDLSSQQHYGISRVLHERCNLFFTGEAGTGKTSTIKQLVAALQDAGEVFHVAAMSGKAAVEIGGTTLHHFLGVGLFRDHPQRLAAQIKRTPAVFARWKNTSTLLIDEISMCTIPLLRKFDEVARLVRGDSQIFGGIRILFFGDFGQCPPIYTEEEPQQDELTFVFEDTKLFPPKEDVILFTKIFRQTDPKFQGLLSRARLGKQTPDDHKLLLSRCINPPPETKIKPTHLFSKKVNVAQINDDELYKLEPDQDKWMSYEAKQQITVKTPEQKKLAEKLLVQFNKARASPMKLHLAVGAQVLLTKNLDVSGGWCNGSSGIVVEFVPDPKQQSESKNPILYPVVQSLRGEKRIVLSELSSIEDKNEVYATDLQVPLLLAWAITIHKSQGLNMDCVSLSLNREIREYGLGYTGLSRCRTIEGLYISEYDPEAIRAHPKMVQYYEDLLQLQLVTKSTFDTLHDVTLDQELLEEMERLEKDTATREGTVIPERTTVGGKKRKHEAILVAEVTPAGVPPAGVTP